MVDKAGDERDQGELYHAETLAARAEEEHLRGKQA